MSNSYYPKELEELISILKELPGIGQRGAERMAFCMLKWPVGKLDFLGEKISNLHEKIKKCQICGNLCENDLCCVCKDPKRDSSIICILEDYTQIPPMEKSGFKGVYHVLGGKLSPLENKGAETLSLKSLISRINSDKVTEVILALSQDVEGQATTIYIAGLLKDKNIKITTLARGIPAGADISFANSATIAAALDGRVLI